MPRGGRALAARLAAAAIDPRVRAATGVPSKRAEESAEGRRRLRDAIALAKAVRNEEAAKGYDDLVGRQVGRVLPKCA